MSYICIREGRVVRRTDARGALDALIRLHPNPVTESVYVKVGGREGPDAIVCPDAVSVDRNALDEAVRHLAQSERGRNTLEALGAFIERGGFSLDSTNQQAVLTILKAQFGAFPGSTLDTISNALHP